MKQADRRIRILAIYRGIVSADRGTPIKVRSLAREFDKRDDISFTLCAWDDSKPQECRSYFRLTNHHLRDLLDIYRFVKADRTDVIIGHTIATYYYLWPLKYLTRAKIVLEMQGYVEEEAKLYNDISPLRYRWSKLIYGMFYRACDLVTTSSETSAEVIRRYNRNVVPIWGGVDSGVFNPNVQPGNSIARKAGDIIIGYTGNLRIWQGVPFLLDAFAELRRKHPEFRLAILASEPVKEKREGVDYLPAVGHDEVPRFSASCDILVIPRPDNVVNRLSFPSKLIEYMAMGKPVVASRTSDAHRIISDGIDGLIYEPGDAAGLVAAFEKLIDPAQRSRLGAAAARTIEEGYQWQHQADRFVQAMAVLAR